MLDQFGLSDEEEAVYLALLDLRRADVESIADALGQASSDTSFDVDRTLVVLEKRGMIFRSGAEYTLVDPALALADVLAARERDLHRARLALDAITARHRQLQGDDPDAMPVETISDPDVAARQVVEIYRHAEREVMAMERPPYAEPNTEPNPIELDLLAKGVTHRVLYEQSAIDQPGRLADLLGGIAAGEQARVAPVLPGRLLVVDHACAILPSTTGGLLTQHLLVVRRGALLDMLVALFEQTWARSIPLGLPEAGAVEDIGVDRVIVSLMASGLTDQAIARQLNMSVRTVQRRIRDLCERLGAGTRFQAGMQAVRERLL